MRTHYKSFNLRDHNKIHTYIHTYLAKRLATPALHQKQQDLVQKLGVGLGRNWIEISL